VFGYELLGVWLRKADFAANSASLLRPMLVGFTLAQAAQFCSASILFGLGAQRGYAITVVAELALNIVATILVLPSYGIIGAAAVTSLLMLIARGIVTPWLLCHHLHLSFGRYMFGVLARPILVSAPLWAALVGLRRAGITGRSVPELAVLCIGTTALYFAGCYFTCVAPEHKRLLRNWLEKKFSGVGSTDA
jgi:O-antigen/teichoic acid export membrane protein